MEEKRFLETVEWFKDVYDINISLHQSKNLSKTNFWINIREKNGNLISTDFFETKHHAIKKGLKIAFTLIK